MPWLGLFRQPSINDLSVDLNRRSVRVDKHWSEFLFRSTDFDRNLSTCINVIMKSYGSVDQHSGLLGTYGYGFP